MYTLHPYQREAVAFLRDRGRAGLFLDMGLGKTAICLSALEPRHLPALVVAPKRVAEHVWETEAKIWRPDLRVSVVKGTPAQRAKALAAPADLYVIGRDNLPDALGGPWRTLIIDELSGYKSRTSQRWKVARKITDTVDYVWGLTGTPTPNGEMDLWSQIYLLDKGQRLGTGVTAFRDRYFVAGRRLPSGIITEWTIRPGAATRIHALLEDLCLSMGTEGRVTLPPVTHNRVEVPLLPKVKRVYKQMKDTLVTDLDLFGGQVHSAQNAAVLSGKLSQVTAGFLYADDQDVTGEPPTVLHHEKIRAVEEIVEGTGSPVLVFFRFQQELKMLKEALGTAAHTIDEPDIVNRWNAGHIPVLLAHPDSAGHGLNLQRGPGHTIVWSSLPWSLEAYQQANKRLARQGQKNPVVIHHVTSPRTVDEAILQRLTEKTTVQDALLNHLESPL